MRKKTKKKYTKLDSRGLAEKINRGAMHENRTKQKEKIKKLLEIFLFVLLCFVVGVAFLGTLLVGTV